MFDNVFICMVVGVAAVFFIIGLVTLIIKILDWQLEGGGHPTIAALFIITILGCLLGLTIYASDQDEKEKNKATASRGIDK